MCWKVKDSLIYINGRYYSEVKFDIKSSSKSFKSFFSKNW